MIQFVLALLRVPEVFEFAIPLRNVTALSQRVDACLDKLRQDRSQSDAIAGEIRVIKMQFIGGLAIQLVGGYVIAKICSFVLHQLALIIPFFIFCMMGFSILTSASVGFSTLSRSAQ